MAKRGSTGWLLQIVSLPLLLIGIHMTRSSFVAGEGANLFGLLTGLTLFLGGLGLFVVGIRAVLEKRHDEEDAPEEEPTA